jgi:heme/copper-type cytochrome/quinol oxidase subunit 4
MPKAILILVLLVLAVWKAVLVALYYMHLRFEPRKLWWVVLSPLPLAVILVAVVLFEAW